VSASLKHEGPLLLLGERPEMLVDLLGIAIPAGASVGLGSAEFTQAVPLERRADAVVTIEENGRTTSAFVVEIQLGIDPDKHFSWPLYLASLHARVRCPTTLVVVAPERSVAAWARMPIPTFAPGQSFAPLVLGPDEIPRVTSFAQARRMPELAVLSALVHGGEEDAAPILDSAIRAAAQLDETRARNYYDLIYSSLGEVARMALEALMSTVKYEYQSDFAKKYVAEGRVDEARRLLLAIMAERRLGTSDEARARIDGCSEPEVLERWVLRATSATAEHDVFELEQT
jgi:hypothetical protein